MEEEILKILRAYLSPILAKSVLSLSVSLARVRLSQLRAGDDRKLVDEMTKGLKVYVRDAKERNECVARLSELLAQRKQPEATSNVPPVIAILDEADIVTARGRGTQLCSELGFPKVVQVKVATVISELARNIVQYAGEGEITITSFDNGIEVVARDEGPGIDDLDAVLSGEYSSETGMGKGLIGTKNIMDEFEVQSKPGMGTEVRVKKFL
jgi:serine/threonine-protein kinase RsbT